MIESSQRIERIRTRFAEFTIYLESSNKDGFFDVNKRSEEFVRELLNLTYGYNLKNLNYERVNHPVIDLGDEDGKICFQVTSNKSDAYLQNFPAKHKEKKYDLKYPKLCIFFLSCGNESQKKVDNAIKQSKLPADNILNLDSVLRHLQSLGSAGDLISEKVLSLVDRNHINYCYVDSAIEKYLKANERRFITDDFVEPYLMEEGPNNKPVKDEWESSHLVNEILIKREIGKLEIRKVLKLSNQFVITGNPGTGKSEIVKNLFNSLIHNNHKYLDEQILPFYFRLTNKSCPEKLEDEIKTELRKYIPNTEPENYEKIISEIVRSHLTSGYLCLILDGYDELEIEDLKKWNEVLRVFIVHHNRVRVILTVRKNRITSDVHLPIQRYFDVLPFDENKIKSYVKAIAKEVGCTDERMISHTIDHIISSKIHIVEPTLIVKMIIQTLLSGKEESLTSKASIYQDYLNGLLVKLLEQKGIGDPEKLGSLLPKLRAASFNFLSIIAIGNTFKNYEYSGLIESKASLNSILEAIETKNGKGYLFTKSENFFVDDLKIIQRYDKQLFFTHFTFQEFFLAIAIHKKLFTFRSKTLRWVLSAYSISKYNQVFLFLFGLMTKQECEKFIRLFFKWPLRQRFQLAKILEAFTYSKIYFLGEVLCEAPKTNRNNFFIEQLTSRLYAGDPLHFGKVCRILSLLEPGSEQIFRKILKALESKSHYNRREGLYIYALASIRKNPNVFEWMKELLYHGDGYVRGSAIIFFGKAQYFDRQIIDRAFELAFISKAYNSIDVQEMVVSLAQISPEACIEYIEKSKTLNDKDLRGIEFDMYCAFLDFFAGEVLNIPKYKEYEYTGRILQFLDMSTKSREIKSNLIRSLGRGGMRPEILLPRLIEIAQTDEELAYAPLMAFRDSFIVRSEIIDLSIGYLESQYPDTRNRAMNYLATVQCITEVIHNGKMVPLSEKIEDLFYNCNEEPHSSYRTYAIEYLGHVNYKNKKLEDKILETAFGDAEIIFSSRDTCIRYLMEVGHFSDKFFMLQLHFQKIRGDLSMTSYDSDRYFENIERFVKEYQLKKVKKKLFDFWANNWVEIWKLRKYIQNGDLEGMVLDQQEERLYRTGLALQKIILCEDEVKQRAKCF